MRRRISVVLERWYCAWLDRKWAAEVARAEKARGELWSNVKQCHAWGSELGGEAPYRSGLVRIPDLEETHPWLQ